MCESTGTQSEGWQFSLACSYYGQERKYSEQAEHGDASKGLDTSYIPLAKTNAMAKHNLNMSEK